MHASPGGSPARRLVPALLALASATAALRAADDFGSAEVAFINEQIAAGWADAGLEPSKTATDGEWCRRVHLDLIGRVPTLAELEGYVADRGKHKRAALVERLLGDEYVDEYARNFTDVWTTILIGRDTTNERVSRPGMRQWLRRAFSRNMPYDRFMEELVTATGVNTNRKGVAGFNGATNFLSGKVSVMGEEQGVQATAKTAQIFLGLQVQCTQCHDHPFNKGKQNQFWELNAFFRQAQALRRFDGGNDVQWVELDDNDFALEDDKSPEEAEIYYELRNGIVKVAYPVFIDGTQIGREGWLPAVDEDGKPFGVNRRQELAKLIRSSPWFSRAIVNRIWGHFLGYGFTKPVDDLGEHNPPSHPELLDGLAERFREGGFDMKQLMRWIVLSKPYSLASRAAARKEKDVPATGERPEFSRFYMRSMTAEQLYESLLTVTQADKTAGSEEAAKKKDEWLSQFVVAFGTDEGDDATTFNGSIPQVLMMFNGDLVQRATSLGKGGFLDRVADGPGSNDSKIDTLYMAALGRKPSRAELKVASSLVAARNGSVAAALQDVWWAVLNSNEFMLNH